MFLLAMAAAGHSAETARFQVVARTGNGLVGLGRETSVNNLGRVALVGTIQGSGAAYENLFSGSGSPGSLLNVSPGILPSGATSATFNPGVQINDLGRILARRYETKPSPLGPIPVTYLESWNATVPSDRSTLAYGEALFGDFDGIYPHASFNNSGGAVFMALDGGQNLVGTLTSGGGFFTGLGGELRRPMMADDNNFVVRSGSSPFTIRLLDPTFNLLSIIAGPELGFSGSSLGRSPGISDDGKMVAFYGEALATNELGLTAGPGIFLAAKKDGGWVYRRVAGVRLNGVLDPGETYEDLNGNGEFDRGQEQDEGTISGFFPDERIGIGNDGGIAFSAKGGAADDGIYASRVDVYSGSLAVAVPKPIVRRGDSIPGVGLVDEVALYDPVTRHAQPEVAFWVRTEGGTEAVVKWLDPIDVVSAVMSDNHTLEIRTTRNFGGGLADISVEVEVDGQVYTSQAGGRGTNSNPADPGAIRFDLRAAGVPRFKGNVRFPVRIIARADDGSEYEERFTCIVPLPVILVPGLNNGQGGEGRFAALIPYLKKRSVEWNAERGVFGAGYRTRGDEGDDPSSGYPTLYALEYDTAGSFADGAARLDTLVNTVLGRTYADRIYLVGYSKGGLISRKYLVSGNGAKVAHFFIVATPNVGALAAKVPFLGDTRLVPVYPAYRRFFGQSFAAFPNKELSDLNNRPENKLPTDTGTKYTVVYNEDLVLPSTSNNITIVANTSVAPASANAFGRGDLIVPDFSALGYIRNMNGRVSNITGLLIDPGEPAPAADDVRIPAFRGVQFELPVRVSAYHLGFMDQPALMKPMFSLLYNLNP